MTVAGGGYEGSASSNNYAEIVANGIQSISANALSISGGIGSASASNNYGSISQLTCDQNQLITFITGNDTPFLHLTGGSGQNAYARIKSSGTQTITSTSSATSPEISLTGGSGNNSFENYAEITAYGTQQITASAIEVQGGTGNSYATNNYARIAQLSAGHAQTIALDGGDDNPTLSLVGGSSGQNAFARIESAGDQSIVRAGPHNPDILLSGRGGGNADNAYSGNAATIVAQGHQQINAALIQLDGGGSANSAGSNNSAEINTYGSQTITANAIVLNGGHNPESSGSNNAARIVSHGPQQISAYSIELTGGGHVNSASSNNAAEITANDEQQISTALLALFGGAGNESASNNYARIAQLGTGKAQTLTINNLESSADLTLRAGASGQSSYAKISSAGNQTLRVADGSYLPLLKLEGGGSSDAAFSNNAAEMLANGDQQITVAALLLTGGSGNNTASGNDARIAQLSTGKTQTISLDGGNNTPFISLTGGTGGHGASATLTSAGHQSIAAINDSAAPTILLQGGQASDGSGNGNFADIQANGSQDISAGSIQLTGGSGSATLLGSYARIAQLASGGAQTIESATDIMIFGGVDNANTASITSAGNQTIEAGGTLKVAGGGLKTASGSGNEAEIRAHGVQAIQANELQIYAGTGDDDAHDNSARILQTKTSGSQTISIQGTTDPQAPAHFKLIGGDGGYQSEARIESYGSQSISQWGTGTLAIELTGGTSGATGAAWTDHPAACPDCATFNQALIKSRGVQNISASQLSISGGEAGIGNSASVKADGAQTLTISDAITLAGGESGGTFIAGYGVDGLLDNGAHLSSETSQNISTGTLQLFGRGGPDSVSGAFLTAPIQTITANSVSLLGGESNVSALGDAPYHAPNITSAAVIGWDEASQITLTVSNSFDMTGGDGSGGNVLLGSLFGTSSIDLSAYGIFAGGNASAAAFVGNGNAQVSTNTLLLRATGTSGIALGNHSHLLAGSNGQLTLTADAGDINQANSDTRLITKAFTATAHTGLWLDGPDNKIYGSANLATTAGDISVNTNTATTHISQATTSSGNIALSTLGDTQSIALGTIYTGSGDVSVLAGAHIYDDNADGLVNITGSNITLTTQGNNSTGVAISADVATPGALIASSGASTGKGGIHIQSVGGSAPTSVSLSDATSNASGGDLYFAHNGNLNANADYHFDSLSGSLILGASGNLEINATDIENTPRGVSLTAGNNLTINALDSTNGLIATAGNTLTLNTTYHNTGVGDTWLWAPTINIGTDTGIWTDTLAVTAGQLNVEGTLSAGNSALVTAQQVHVNGGRIRAESGTLNMHVTGNLLMNGGEILAGNTAKFSFSSTDSMFYINRYANQAVATVTAGSATNSGLITVDYLARTEGGCLIDGVATFSPLMTTSGSGFFNYLSQATLGTDLLVTYATPVSTPDPSTSLATSTTNQLTNTILSSTGNSETQSNTPSRNSVTPALPAQPSTGTTTGSGGSSNNEEFGGGAVTDSGGTGTNGTTRNSQNRGMCR